MREYHCNIYISKCKTDSWWKVAVLPRELSLAVCNDLRGGWNGQKGSSRGREMCTLLFSY